MTSLSFTTTYDDINYYIEAEVTVYTDNLGVDRSDFVTFDTIDLRAFNEVTMEPVIIYEILGLRDALREDLDRELWRLGIL
jgi:hypothetical protein